MTLAGDAWRSSCALALCVSLIGAAGCSSTQAADQGTGGSGSAGGDVESEDAISPRAGPEPLLAPAIAGPRGKGKGKQGQRRKREEECRNDYYQCIALGGEYEKRGQHGQTVCQSCYEVCKGKGSWPAEVNDLPCLGGY